MTRRFALVAALMLLFIAFVVGILYAYRALSPATREIPLSGPEGALSRLDQGQVKTVTLNGNTKATLETNDGARYEVLLTGDDTLAKAVNAYNRAHPDRQVTLRVEQQSPTLGVIGSVILSLLPLVLFIAFPVALVLGVASTIARARSGDRYEALTRAADLRDRGVLSQDEFEREKQRILR